MVVQEEDREPEHAVLRREYQRAADRDAPEPRVAKRLPRAARRSSPTGAGPLAKHEAADRGRDEAGTAHRREAEPGAAVPHERRQRERGGEAAERDRGLADGRARRRAAVRGNHATTARPLADCTLAPANPASISRRSSGGTKPDPRRGEQRGPAATHTGDEHRAARRTGRSRAPTGSRLSTDPASEAEISAPVSPSVSP